VGGGAYLGLAGAVVVNVIDSDTFAAIDGGSRVNWNTSSTTAGVEQGVNVSAKNRVDIITVAGAGAVSLGAGIGASVDMGMIRNDTNAVIGGSGTQVRARRDVDVNALSIGFIDSVAFGIGGGSVGLGGGFIVYSIGGNFSDRYTSEGDGTSSSDNALTGK